jgi:hypothetical protein
MTADDAQDLRPRLLFMPHPGEDYDDRAEADPGQTAIERPEDWDYPFYPVFGADPADPEPLFRFRWIAGHQVSFLLWRAIGDIVHSRQADVPDERELEVLAACVDAYSAMLIYSSTVPREHYHEVTRAQMALQHPAFSGTWAPDYRPIRRLFRSRFGWQDDAACAPLEAAVRRNRKTHAHIADHLVPDGKSLLQRSASGTDATVSQEKEDLYDNFFMTVRRPVGHAEIVAQLDRRVAEFAVDLRRNGLYPNVDGRHAPVVAEPDEDMTPFTQDVLGTARRAAWLVSRMAPAGARS